MKLSIQLKSFLVSMALVLGSFALADIYISGRIESEMLTFIEDDLLVRAQLGATVASVMPTPLTDVAAWDSITDKIGASADGRVTIVRRDGVVIGDSSLDLNALTAVENHSGRPEIASALSAGNGASVRFSKTLQMNEVYVAVPFSQNGNVLGVVRVAKPLNMILVAVNHVRNILLLGAVIALVVTNFITFMAASLYGGMLRGLTGSVKRMTSGDLTARTGAETSDEVGELGRAIDEFATKVNQSQGSQGMGQQGMGQQQGMGPQMGQPYDPRFPPR
jgi:two-component system, OmpR family, phosphate regulon sensor histidine kinase PhoR